MKKPCLLVPPYRDSNKDQYTRREVDDAEKARRLYRKIGNPSEQEFSDLLKDIRIWNCPLTPDDAHRALHIWGTAVQTLEGKMTKQQNKGIPNYKPILIPAPIIAKYNTIRLFIDIFWVNGSPYFHTISEYFKFRTVAAIKNRTKNTLLMETKAILTLYATRSFTISRIEWDREFACITMKYFLQFSIPQTLTTTSTKSNGPYVPSRSACVAPSKDYPTVAYHVL